MTMYVTPADMIRLFSEREMIEATNSDDPSAVSIDLQLLEQHCTAASGIVDGWLMRRFVVPLENPVDSLLEVLKAHAAILCRELLDGSREEVVKNADNTREWLDKFTDPSSSTAGGDVTPGVESTRFGSIAFDLSGNSASWGSVWEVF